MKNTKRISLILGIQLLLFSSAQAQSLTAHIWSTHASKIHKLEGILGLCLIGSMAFAYKKLHVKHITHLN